MAMKPKVFPRAYRIGQVAALTGLTPDTLRYYERLGLLPPAPRTKGGFRLYSRATLERLGLIRHAQDLGLSLDEIRELVRSLDGRVHRGYRDDQERVASVLAHLESKLTELREFRRLLRSYCTERGQSAPQPGRTAEAQ